MSRPRAFYDLLVYFRVFDYKIIGHIEWIDHLFITLTTEELNYYYFYFFANGKKNLIILYFLCLL